MAQLKDSLITGDLRVTGTIYGLVDKVNDVVDYNDGKPTKFGYSTSGMTSASWIGAWDATTSGEYRLRAISPQNLRNTMGLGNTTGALPVANGGTGQTTAAGIFNVVRDNGGNSTWVNVSGDTMTGFLTLHANPTSNLHAATKQYVDNAFAANDAMIFKGIVNANGDLPANHKVGWTYRVGTAGTYAGNTCEVGDLIICITDGTAANNAHWVVAQANIDGAVIGPTSATNGNFALFNGTTGKLIKNSSYSPSSFILSNTNGNTQNLYRPLQLNGTSDNTIDAKINDLRANRLAFLPADQIIIEKTTDGGSTWVDAEVSDAVKVGLFSETRPTVWIPTIDGKKNINCGLRITFTAMKYNVPAGTAETQKYNYWNSNYVISTGRYNQLKEMYFWVSANSDTISVKVERATGAASTNWITVFENNSWGMTGWSGNDYIRFSQNVFGGGTNQTGNSWNYRLTFFTRGPGGSTTLSTSNTTSAQGISEIRGYGDTWWVAGNSYAASDHIYSHDYNKNVVFPAKVTATEFIGAINATSPAIITNTKIPLSAGKVTSLAANSSRLYSDGLAISNPATANDVGWIRVTGTGESDTVMEIATGDDAGAGEKIVARQYNTSNAVAKEAQILGINGVTTFPVSVTVQGTTDATSSTAATLISSGGLAVAKKAWIGSGLGASSTSNNSSHLIISSSDTGAGGNVALELWRGTNASWQIGNEGGNLHFRTNWTTAKQTTYSVDAVHINYNSGDTTFKGSITASSVSTPNGSIWAGTAGNTTAERNVGVRSGAGNLYLYSNASTTGNRGLYAGPHGTDTAGKGIITIDTNNVASFNGNASTATKLASTGTTAQFWRGDNAWSDTISGGLLKITNNSTTLSLGANNTSWVHFTNTAGYPYYFDKQVNAVNGFKVYNTTTALTDNSLTFSQGGGWNMNDSTWIRSVGNKSIYQNSGTLRTDGTLQVGNNGAYLNADTNGVKISPRLTMVSGKPINQILTGTGTAATTSGSNYVPAKWTFNAGVTVTDGDIFTIKIPVAGHDYGVFMSVNNGTNYYPVVVSGTSRVTSHYPVNNYIQVVFEASGSAASMFPLAGGTSRVTVSGGVFRILNFYDSGNSGLYQNYSPKTYKVGTTAITQYDLVAEDNTGLLVPAHKIAHRVGSPIFISDRALAANATGSWANLYDRHYSYPIRNSGTNITTTAYNPIYLKGTIANGMFTPDTTTPFITTKAACNVTGAYYMYIGDATTSNSYIAFNNSHTYYYYNGSALVHWTQAQSGPNIYYNSGTQTLHIDYVSNSQITTLSQTVSQLTALHATSGGTMKTVAQEIADNGGTITQNTLLNINGTQFRIQNA